jgi:hypothetical protein
VNANESSTAEQLSGRRVTEKDGPRDRRCLVIPPEGGKGFPGISQLAGFGYESLFPIIGLSRTHRYC